VPDLEAGESVSSGGIQVVADLSILPSAASGNSGVDQVALNLGIDGSPRGLWCMDAGGSWQPVPPIVLGRGPQTATAVELTTTDQTFINVPIPAGTLGVPSDNRVIRCELYGQFVNSAAGNRQFIPTISYGGSVMWSDTSSNIGAGETVGVVIQGQMKLDGATNAQRLGALAVVGGPGSVLIGGTGDLGSDEVASHAAISGTAAVDSTAGNDLVIAARTNNATGTKTFQVNSYLIELL
jgi:hypothetical protein